MSVKVQYDAGTNQVLFNPSTQKVITLSFGKLTVVGLHLDSSWSDLCQFDDNGTLIGTRNLTQGSELEFVTADLDNYIYAGTTEPYYPFFQKLSKQLNTIYTRDWDIQDIGVSPDGLYVYVAIFDSTAKLVKLNQAGGVEWTHDFGTNRSYLVRRIWVDPVGGDIYVNQHSVTWKISAAGARLWECSVYGPNFCRDMRVGKDGYLYLALCPDVGNGWIEKWDTDQYHLYWGGAIDGPSQPGLVTSIDADAAGNVYVGAQGRETGVYKLAEANGAVLWRKQYNVVDELSYVHDLMIGGGSEIFVGGTIGTDEASEDTAALRKIDSAGDITWRVLSLHLFPGRINQLFYNRAV